ncbi:MAG: hypothetical protein H6828_06860 [Planctomycetes bacterium]|nr:hypothetical protein [Planctomycetota bacterium]
MPRLPRTSIALLLSLAGCAGVAPVRDAETRAAFPTPDELLDHRLVAALAGDSVVLWTGRVGARFDVGAQTWAPLPENPWSRDGDAPRLVALDDATLAAAYVVRGAEAALHVDTYSLASGAWSTLARLPIADVEEPGVRGELALGELVQVDGELLVLFGHRYVGAPVQGALVARSGAWRAITSGAAPPFCADSSFAYAHRGRVVYGGYADVVRDTAATWERRADAWGPVHELHARYDFGHCCSGDALYVVGGVWSSFMPRPLREGLLHALAEDAWSPWPVDLGPGGRRSPAVCWTDRGVFVWGGDAIVYGRDRPRAEPQRSGWLFAAGAAPGTPIATESAPSAGADRICLWTGREVFVLGRGADDGAALEVHAYDPTADRWRALPSFAR